MNVSLALSSLRLHSSSIKLSALLLLHLLRSKSVDCYLGHLTWHCQIIPHIPYILYIFDKFKFLSFKDGDYSLISNQINKVFTQHFSFPRIGFCQLIAVLKSAWITIYKIHNTSLNLKLVIGTDNGTRNSFFLKLKFDSLQAEFPFLIYNQTFNYFQSLFKRNHQFIYDIGTHNYSFLSLFFAHNIIL